MPYFTISYIPNVENIENVEVVENVKNVEVVQDVRKLPHPYFPLKKYNYQCGGSLHVEASVNYYFATYVPEFTCEFKGVSICCTSYNIEDKYDLYIGSRLVIKNSHVKEMTEYRMFETYEVVPAGTPITIRFHNKSGLEKFLLYDFIMLVNDNVINNESVMNWNFTWGGTDQILGTQDTLSLYIAQPNTVNLDSEISTFTLNFVDLHLSNSWTISCNASGVVTTNYVEPPGSGYSGAGLLGRANIIGIVSVKRHQKSIEIMFKNLSSSGTVNPYDIRMSLSGSVNNIVNGGI